MSIAVIYDSKYIFHLIDLVPEGHQAKPTVSMTPPCHFTHISPVPDAVAKILVADPRLDRYRHEKTSLMAVGPLPRSNPSLAHN